MVYRYYRTSSTPLPQAIYHARSGDNTSGERVKDTDMIVDGLLCDQLDLPGVDINTMPAGSILRVTPQTGEWCGVLCDIIITQNRLSNTCHCRCSRASISSKSYKSSVRPTVNRQWTLTN